jgi:hypothetical protein
MHAAGGSPTGHSRSNPTDVTPSYYHQQSGPAPLPALNLPCPPVLPPGHINMLPQTLRANLPRVWEKVAGSLAEPIRPSVSHEHPLLIGGDYEGKLIRDINDITSRRVHNDVIRPMERWCNALGIAKVSCCGFGLCMSGNECCVLLWSAGCVLCAVCCVLCAVCCVLCAVCCVLCAVCCVLCAVCCCASCLSPPPPPFPPTHSSPVHCCHNSHRLHTMILSIQVALHC